MTKKEYKHLVGDYIYPDLTTLTYYVPYEEDFILELWHTFGNKIVNPYSHDLKAFNVNDTVFCGPIFIYSDKKVSHELWEDMLTRFWEKHFPTHDLRKQ